MTESLLLREDRGPVVVLTMNRPDKRNALSRSLISALSDAFDQIAASPGSRAVILAGAGKTFCAGMDLREAADVGAAPEAEKQAVDDVQSIAHLIDQVHRLPRPTIAAVGGDALAGGAGLALACDFVVMAAEAHIAFPEVRRGLVAAVVLHDLVRQVGDRRARELLLTGAPIAATDAQRWGLANRVVAAEWCVEEAKALAQSLLESAPRALATTKRLLDEATARPKDLRGAAAISASVRVGDEADEGMRAFLEKRRPNWFPSESSA
jgi:methylglutaconyl-CoA hydratase